MRRSALPKLNVLWSRLRDVRTLRFESSSAAGTGWVGKGAGIVAVSEPSDADLVFTESGTWRPRDGSRLGFFNVYRWSRFGDALRLEHLRFGADRPVSLFEIVPSGDGGWREASPHVCGEDCYAASLSLRGRQVVVAWTVRGPTKRESIRYTYGLAARSPRARGGRGITPAGADRR